MYSRLLIIASIQLKWNNPKLHESKIFALYFLT